MKKLLILTVAITLLFSSCSKEVKFNRKLDGKWAVITEDGLPNSEYSTVFEFNKSNKSGVVTLTETEFSCGCEEIYSGKYTLSNDDIITMTFTDEAYADVLIATVNSYGKNDLTFTIDESVFVLQKK